MNSRPTWVNSIGKWLRNHIPLGRLSYAQEGEDLVLARLLEQLKLTKGFFVDIGAHHPTRFSNTYYFYKRGWQGINIDALPGTEKLFHRVRPKDITIECGVGSSSGSLNYYLFNEPALNTFSEEEARKKANLPYKITEVLQLPVLTLKQILDENLPKDTKIDFLTIDAEGFDHEVIISNDWKRYHPSIVLVELLGTSLQHTDTHPTAQVLIENNYRLFAKTINTYFFVSNVTFPN